MCFCMAQRYFVYVSVFSLYFDALKHLSQFRSVHRSNSVPLENSIYFLSCVPITNPFLYVLECLYSSLRTNRFVGCLHHCGSHHCGSASFPCSRLVLLATKCDVSLPYYFFTKSSTNSWRSHFGWYGSVTMPKLRHSSACLQATHVSFKRATIPSIITCGVPFFFMNSTVLSITLAIICSIFPFICVLSAFNAKGGQLTTEEKERAADSDYSSAASLCFLWRPLFLPFGFGCCSGLSLA